MEGLLNHRTPALCVKEGKGRGVLATAPIEKGSYICEYKSSQVYPLSERAKFEREYAINGEGCMIIDAHSNS